MKNLIICAVLALGITGSAAAQNKALKKPNVIVIVSDDAGYVDFGCYGGKQIPTPNIDGIAAKGILFTDAYVSASVCAPSRAGILTGRYQQRFGFEHNTSHLVAPGFNLTDVGMDPAEQTIADEMKANGYKTIAIGKWHQGEEAKHFPLQRGFDEFYGFIGGHRDFFAYKTTPTKEQALYSNSEVVPESKVSYLTDMFTDKAISFIGENKEKPFFMYLSYNAVHTPMNAKKDLMERYASIADPGRRAYAAMMTSLDDNVGRVLEAIKQHQLDQHTLIIFVNDNGGATVNSSDNGPLRGMKGSKWEGGIRVAMLMKWPGQLPENKTYTLPVSVLDILPTAIAAGNGKEKGIKKLDGVNLLPYLKGQQQKAPHQALYWRRGVAAAMRENQWKLIRVKDNVLLFDLTKDLSEKYNIAQQHPAVVKAMLAKLVQWEKGLDQPHWISSYGDQNQIMKHRMETTGREMERMYP
ncbi:sulfatase [Pedobacter gandavensis]|uniref:sulfatase n=1 Tax=Pedobacter gandavensis TaxID=2679963 RepID=UPI00247ABF44|nr:sulfatase [Pedobacter gandavensis]WGQ11313.1 sulfatase [Pedobacter gandavensis]